MCNGVQVVVPQHLAAQSKYANVAFVNISNVKVDGNCPQIEYNGEFSVSALEPPFDRPDIVVFHECYRIQYIKIARELSRMGVPYVIIPHGELSNDAQKKKYLKKKIANILIFNRFINKAAAVQLLSQTEADNTRFGRLKFIGTNGIGIPERKKESFSERGTSFVYIGRLDVYHKGLDLMLNGLGKCADIFRENSCTLDIYGPDILGRLEQVKELVEANGIGDIVRLHAPVFDGEKEKVLLDADIFIQTSRFEGMPMGILEALSYGVPCVVTEGTTLAEFVKSNGAGITSATDEEGVAEAIKSVLARKNELLSMSQKGREAVLRDFAWDGIAAKAVEKYGELAKK